MKIVKCFYSAKRYNIGGIKLCKIEPGDKMRMDKPVYSLVGPAYFDVRQRLCSNEPRNKGA